MTTKETTTATTTTTTERTGNFECHSLCIQRDHGFYENLTHYLLLFYLFNIESCSQDSDCDTANCFYCLSNGKCSKFDTEYCDSAICGKGDGDCDSSDQCSSGLVCGQNNFLDLHPLLTSCNKASISEVCMDEGKVVSFEFLGQALYCHLC